MSIFSETKREWRGEFGGFIETAGGKRRLVLRSEGENLEFKLPKELRRAYAGQLVPGQTVLLRGVERRESVFGARKRVVSALLVTGTPPERLPACGSCVIRVCAKKNCWKQGGNVLWETLESEVTARALGSVHE